MNQLVNAQALLPVGEIISIAGSKARARLFVHGSSSDGNVSKHPPIGSVVSIDTGYTIVLGIVTAMTSDNSPNNDGNSLVKYLEFDLSGDLKRHSDGYISAFRRGVSIYPQIGDKVAPASPLMLEKIYGVESKNGIEVGHLHQNSDIKSYVQIDDMLGKHFAILGSTGSGKSCTVALVLRRILEGHPNAHILLLDPHNEYGNCFGNLTEKIGMEELNLPFWVLNFEETVEILIGRTEGFDEEIEILREIIPQAKRKMDKPSTSSSSSSILRRDTTTAAGGASERYSVDVPMPYRMNDLLALIDDEMGRLEKSREIKHFKRLKARIQTVITDPRYAFMFGHHAVNANLLTILKRLFRIPVEGKPICVLNMMGIPSDVVNVVVSVLARLAFDVSMWSRGSLAITLVCEEAHRYVPRAQNLGFEPTKRAISRIAKEGRKYGSSICVVTQRPGDLDPTILSQCSTIFTMRLSNEDDQRIVRAAISDASVSMLSFLSTLGTRECIIFGEGISLPSRVVLNELSSDCLPGGDATSFGEAWKVELNDDRMLRGIINRWRLTNKDRT